MRSARFVDGLWRAALRVAYPLQLAWWRIRRPRLTGAAVAVWYEGRVLVIRNSYRRLHSLPAGGVGRREDTVSAAARELREEAGIAVTPGALAFVGEFVETTRYAEDHVHLFELHCERPPEVRVDGREVIWAAFLTPAQAIERGVVGYVRGYLQSVAKT